MPVAGALPVVAVRWPSDVHATKNISGTDMFRQLSVLPLEKKLQTKVISPSQSITAPGLPVLALIPYCQASGWIAIRILIMKQPE